MHLRVHQGSMTHLFDNEALTVFRVDVESLVSSHIKSGAIFAPLDLFDLWICVKMTMNFRLVTHGQINLDFDCH